MRHRANRCEELAPVKRTAKHARSTVSALHCETMRADATICDDDAGVAQLVEHQPSKLNVEGSNPFTRFRNYLIVKAL